MFELKAEYSEVDEAAIKVIIDAFKKTVYGTQPAGVKRRTPQEMFLNTLQMLTPAIKDITQDQAMAVTVLQALIHHSLRAVTWDAFIPEFEGALRNYVKEAVYAQKHH